MGDRSTHNAFGRPTNRRGLCPPGLAAGGTVLAIWIWPVWVSPMADYAQVVEKSHFYPRSHGMQWSH